MINLPIKILVTAMGIMTKIEIDGRMRVRHGGFNPAGLTLLCGRIATCCLDSCDCICCMEDFPLPSRRDRKIRIP